MSFWNGNFTSNQVEAIIEKIRKSRSIGENGELKLNYAEKKIWSSILISAIGLDFKSDALREKVVLDAISSNDLEIDFSLDDFKGKIYQLRNKYQFNELETYRVAFPICNLPKFIQSKKRIDGVTLNFTPSENSRIFKKIKEERKMQQTGGLFKSHFNDRLKNQLDQCSICLCHVKACSPEDANEQAAEAVYEFLGLLNLAIDRNKQWRASFRVEGKLPVSEVLIAPHTTTHRENGKLTHDGFWHENWNGAPEKKSSDEKKMAAWEKRFKSYEKAISSSPWKNLCKEALARHYKAFSNPNLEESFFEGWRLFERITGARREKISEQIRRASKIFENNSEYEIVGKHLEFRRNSLAHGYPIKIDDHETVAFQMLTIVAPFLEQFILNTQDLNTVEELWEFFDLPAKRSEREAKRLRYQRRLKLLAKAAKFRGENEG